MLSVACEENHGREQEWLCTDVFSEHLWLRSESSQAFYKREHRAERWWHRPASNATETNFHKHVAKWRDETGHLPVKRRIAHSSYLSIIAMGQVAVPLILRELNAHPDHWLVALHALTGEDPGQPGDTFDEAVEAWLDWGRRRGHLI